MAVKLLKVIFHLLLIQCIMSMGDITSSMKGEKQSTIPQQISSNLEESPKSNSSNPLKFSKLSIGRAFGSMLGYMGHGTVLNDDKSYLYKAIDLGQTYETVNQQHNRPNYQLSERNKKTNTGLRMMFFFVERSQNFELIFEQQRPLFVYRRLKSKDGRQSLMSNLFAETDNCMKYTVLYTVFNPRTLGNYLVWKPPLFNDHILPPMIQRFDIEVQNLPQKSPFAKPHIGTIKQHDLAKMIAESYYKTNGFPSPTALWSNDFSIPIDVDAWKEYDKFEDNARQFRRRLYKEFAQILEHSRLTDDGRLSWFPITFQPYLPYRVLDTPVSLTIGANLNPTTYFKGVANERNKNDVVPRSVEEPLYKPEGSYEFKIRVDEDNSAITRVFISETSKFPVPVDKEVHAVVCMENKVGVQLVLEQITPENEFNGPQPYRVDYPTQTQFGASPHLISSNGNYWCLSYQVRYDLLQTPRARYGPLERVPSSLGGIKTKIKPKDVFLRLSLAIRSNNEEPSPSIDVSQNHTKKLSFIQKGLRYFKKEKKPKKKHLPQRIQPEDYLHIRLFLGNPIVDLDKLGNSDSMTSKASTNFSNYSSGWGSQCHSNTEISETSSPGSKKSSDSSFSLSQLDPSKKFVEVTKQARLMWAGLLASEAVADIVKNPSENQVKSTASVMFEIDPFKLPV